MCEAVEPIEWHVRAVLEDALRALDPVGQLAGDQVPDDVPRTPAVLGHIRRVGPLVGQADEEGTEQLGCPTQQVGRRADDLAHSAIVQPRPTLSDEGPGLRR